MPAVAKRSYGTGRLYVVVDRAGRASWYGSWWAGNTRVKRKVGIKRASGSADGLTRTQAERELRRLIDATLSLPRARGGRSPKRGRRTSRASRTSWSVSARRSPTTAATCAGTSRRSSATDPWTAWSPPRSSATCTPSVARASRPRQSRTTSTSCTASSPSRSGAAGRLPTPSRSSSGRARTGRPIAASASCKRARGAAGGQPRFGRPVRGGLGRRLKPRQRAGLRPSCVFASGPTRPSPAASGHGPPGAGARSRARCRARGA